MMNKSTTIRNFTVIIVFFIVAFSCGGDKTILRADLNLALRLSGENRPELEKVLKHYSTNEKDSLKLKAAKFLISNMIRHYSIAGEYMDEYMKKVDSVFPGYPNAVKNVYYMMPARFDKVSHFIEKKLDLQTIKGDFLIRNIDYSFGLWENTERLKNVSFDDFCEYILPYNVNHEPLIEWKDSSMFNYYGMKNLDVYEPDLEIYGDYIRFLLGDYCYATTMKSPDTLIGTYSPDCIDRAFNEVMLKRSMGMPSTIDYVPHYPTSENRHYWVVDIDDKFKFSKKTTFMNPYTAKVYRKTYSINPIPEDMINFVPDILRDPYSKDVTEMYEKVTTIECQLDNVPSNVKYGYLAVFNNLAWKEVAWSKLKNGRLTFEKMGPEVIYMPTYYIKNSQKFGKYPLYVNLNGEVIEIIPNKTKTQKLTLNRKFIYRIFGENYGNSFVGCDILASNDLKNMKFDTMATIGSYRNMAFDTVHIKSDKKYKNWLLRKYNDITYPARVSELEFFNNDGELPKNKHFIINHLNQIDTTSGISNKIFDGDILTSAEVAIGVGLSFDEPVSVSYVKYLSSNDGNGIYPDNEYELFYFDNGDWVSLGRKMATNYAIDYDNVPTNALLWLRNCTKGKEERPFMIINGKVKFW